MICLYFQVISTRFVCFHMRFLHDNFSRHFCDARFRDVFIFTCDFTHLIFFTCIYFQTWFIFIHDVTDHIVMRSHVYLSSLTSIIMGEKHMIVYEMYVLFFPLEGMWVFVTVQGDKAAKSIFRSRGMRVEKCAMARATSCKTELASNWHDLLWCEISKTRKSRGIWIWAECTRKPQGKKKSDNLYHVMNETTLKSVLELQSSRSQCYKKKQYMKMC